MDFLMNTFRASLGGSVRVRFVRWAESLALSADLIASCSAFFKARRSSFPFSVARARRAAACTRSSVDEPAPFAAWKKEDDSAVADSILVDTSLATRSAHPLVWALMREMFLSVAALRISAKRASRRCSRAEISSAVKSRGFKPRVFPDLS